MKVEITSIKFRNACEKDKEKSTDNTTVYSMEKYQQIFLLCSKPLDRVNSDHQTVTEYGKSYGEVVYFVDLDALNHIEKKAAAAIFPCEVKLIINSVPRFGKFSDELVDIDFNVEAKKVA